MSDAQTSNPHPASGQHLTDEQCSNLLLGNALDRHAEIHLAACATCRAEMDVVGDAVGEFNDRGLAWAEREAARRVHTPSRWTLRLGVRPVWNAGLMTAATAIVLAVALRMPQSLSLPAPARATAEAGSTVRPSDWGNSGIAGPSAVASSSAGSPKAGDAGSSAAGSSGRSALADDNRLLSSIDRELSYVAQPTVPVTELNGAGQGRASSIAREPVAD